MAISGSRLFSYRWGESSVLGNQPSSEKVDLFAISFLLSPYTYAFFDFINSENGESMA